MNRILLVVTVLIVGIIALQPFGIVMPSSAQMTAAGLLLALLVVLIGILWQQKPSDEREEEIFAQRGQYAYFIGLLVGSVGIVYGAISHSVDWWLVAVIGSMLAVKLFHKK